MAQYVLGDRAKQELSRVVEQMRRSLRTVPGRDVEPFDLDGAPETYLALTPDAGIAALDPGASETGTGTSTASYDDAPGHAECRVFRVTGYGTSAVLQPVSGLTKVVYNVSEDDIPGSTWILVTRDKFGQWFALFSSGGAGDSIAVDVVHVVNATGDTGTGTSSADAGTGTASGSPWKVRQVTLTEGGSFVEPDGATEWTDVYEGRCLPSYPGTPAIIDPDDGTATHATVLYRNSRDPAGVYFINFPGRVDTATLTAVTDVTNAVCNGTDGGFTFDIVETNYLIEVDFGLMTVTVSIPTGTGT